MDVTVYLPDEIRARAKAEKLNLSRLLREAVTREFERKDAMDAALDAVETYEIWPVEIKGVLATGRITGKLIAQAEDPQDGVVYLTTDKRVLGHDIGNAAVERLDDPPAKLVENLANFFSDAGPDWESPFVQACQALGVKPVIDL